MISALRKLRDNLFRISPKDLSTASGVYRRGQVVLVFAMLCLVLTRFCPPHFHLHAESPGSDIAAIIELASDGPHVGDSAHDEDIEAPVVDLIGVSVAPSLDMPMLVAAIMLALLLPLVSLVFDPPRIKDSYRSRPRFSRPQGRAPPLALTFIRV